MPRVFVDADGCPVKEEIYKVARRYSLRVTLVANTWMRAPTADWLDMVVVDDGFDAADDWIVERAGEDDIVVTTDIPLAARCLKKSARVLGPKGRVFTTDSIGDALASREVHSHMRELGIVTGGPAPFTKQDRSRFLQRFDEIARACTRND